jgi:hypothetical protein
LEVRKTFSAPDELQPRSDFPCSPFIHRNRDLYRCNSVGREFVCRTSRDGSEVCRHALLGKSMSTAPSRDATVSTKPIFQLGSHSGPTRNIHDLADWFGLNYRRILLDSTLNGIRMSSGLRGPISWPTFGADSATGTGSGSPFRPFPKYVMDLKHPYSKPVKSGAPLYHAGFILSVSSNRGPFAACGLEIPHSVFASLAPALAVGKRLERFAVMTLLASEVLQSCRYEPALRQILKLNQCPATGSEELCAQS